MFSLVFLLYTNAVTAEETGGNGHQILTPAWAVYVHVWHNSLQRLLTDAM